MRRRTRSIVLLGTAALVLAGCAAEPSDETEVNPAQEPPETTGQETDDGRSDGSAITLSDTGGGEVGTVTFSEVDGGTEVSLEVQGLDQGFYGFHIHGTGLCEPDSAAPDDPTSTGAFLSAGGHLGSDEADHPMHRGDLPSLYVTASGEGWLTTVTDGFTVEELTDEDGSAVMLHSGPDNFANVPERYAPDGPDEDTLNTGDAGPRLACGVVE